MATKSDNGSRFGPAHDDRQSIATERKKMTEANVLHLIDLKRAGHSPKKTELIITPDAISPRYAKYESLNMSMTGSCAAMCVNIA